MKILKTFSFLGRFCEMLRAERDEHRGGRGRQNRPQVITHQIPSTGKDVAGTLFLFNA